MEPNFFKLFNAKRLLGMIVQELRAKSRLGRSASSTKDPSCPECSALMVDDIWGFPKIRGTF